ncbi:MAG TPA: hypothetical protein VK558_16175 [Patescibacteria group bacterium]|nr:hypothetical protein [Patescibacteria group bacterium]
MNGNDQHPLSRLVALASEIWPAHAIERDADSYRRLMRLGLAGDPVLRRLDYQHPVPPSDDPAIGAIRRLLALPED